MFRRKHRSGNLKQEREKITQYLQSFLSRVRDPEYGDPGKGDDAAAEDATLSGSTSRRITEDARNKVLAAESTSAAIRLSALDVPGPSRVEPSKKKSDPVMRKSTQDKSTQMWKNLSTQKLQADEQDDDDSDQQEYPQRPKYILVGWDRFRSKLMVLLIVLFLLWVAIYFPLIGS
nr:uncharacterized protein LOC116433664 [Nomia melanderi]